jgi:hypothetical protein
MENKIGIGAMRVTRLLNMRQLKAKTSFTNRFKAYKKLLQETGNKVSFEKTKWHILMANELETDIVLVCCDALKYFLLAVILLCLFQTGGVYSQC